MTPTTESAMDSLIETAIVAISPGETYKGAEEWKPYNRETREPTRSRRFRLVWEAAERFEGGIFTPRAVETVSTLIVRTDYAGAHEHQQRAVIADHWQLQEAIQALKGASTGIILVRSAGKPDFGTADPSTDVVRVDHTFLVRYLRARSG